MCKEARPLLAQGWHIVELYHLHQDQVWRTLFSSRSVTNWKLFVPLLLIAVLGVFWLPYHVPVKPSLSDSYLYGFNNRVAWLSFLLLLGICLFLSPPASRTRLAQRPLRKRTLGKALAGTFLVALVFCFAVRALDAYGENDLFLDRLRLVLQGRVPYRDFEYPYGVTFLYVPAAFAHFAHLQAYDAYAVTYILVSLLGVTLLWVSLRWIDGSEDAKRSVFLFVWALSLALIQNVGLNYTLIRYSVPVFWILLIHRAMLGTTSAQVSPFLLTVLGYVLMLLISPELAVALTAGSLLYLLLVQRPRSGRQLLVWSLTLGALAGLSALALRLGVFRTLLAFRAGGANFPVIPTTHLWLFLLTGGVTAASAGTLLRSRSRGTALPLLCYSLLASAAAFGRCDPIHVLLNGLGLTVCGLVVLAEARLPWRAALWLFWLDYLILPMAPGILGLPRGVARTALPSILALEPSAHATRFDHWLLHHLQRKDPIAGAAEYEANLTVARHAPLDLSQLFGQPTGTVYEIPFSFIPPRTGRYHADTLDEGYYIGLVNVGTPGQIQEKVNELKAHPERPLLLPIGVTSLCSQKIAGDPHAISTLFLFPFHAKVVHPDNLTLPLCSYIFRQYRPGVSAASAGIPYSVWTPTNSSRHQ